MESTWIHGGVSDTARQPSSLLPSLPLPLPLLRPHHHHPVPSLLLSLSSCPSRCVPVITLEVSPSSCPGHCHIPVVSVFVSLSCLSSLPHRVRPRHLLFRFLVVLFPCHPVVLSLCHPVVSSCRLVAGHHLVAWNHGPANGGVSGVDGSGMYLPNLPYEGGIGGGTVVHCGVAPSSSFPHIVAPSSRPYRRVILSFCRVVVSWHRCFAMSPHWLALSW
jgi:hypothetical protein